jgi:flagellar protein FliS
MNTASFAVGGGARAYARVNIESGIMAADPHRLIIMLFDGAESAIRSARTHMAAGNVAEKGKSISRAIDIINRGLLAALDRERGGEIAENLGLIYEYITNQLLRANVKNDQDALDLAERLLTDISSAWRQLEVSGGAG